MTLTSVSAFRHTDADLQGDHDGTQAPLSIIRTVEKAKQLGMRVDFTLGTGWPYGGPWIPIELSSQCIKMSAEDVVGPVEYGVTVPGGLGEREKLVGLFAAQALGSEDVLDPATLHDLTPYLRYSDPKYWAVVRPPAGWPVPPGRWKIISMKQVPTRQAVRCASLGDEGLVLDHFSRKALERHLDVVGGAFKKAVGDEFGKTVRAVFCDSFEIHLPHQSYYWTSDLLAESQKRKGYDLAPHLPALWFNVGEKTARIRYDFIHVLSQLIMENFFVPLRQWSEENNLKSRVQSHGSIAELLEGYGVNSIGEGEQVNTREPQVSMHRKYASSAGHLYGHPLVSAESFTFLTPPKFPIGSFRYLVNLELMKSVVDPALRDGYTEIINHGYAYNDPDEKTEPFIEMFASSVIRHTEPWWQYYHHFTEYLARSCCLLQQGNFVGDVAVLSPIPDAWSRAGVPETLYWSPEATIRWGELASLIVHSGYDFNLINDKALLEKPKLEGDKLVIGGTEHSALVLPNLTFIPLETLERVRDFCQAGGLVVATERLPEFATGYENFREKDRRVASTVRELFGDVVEKQPQSSHDFGKGKAILVHSLAELPRVLREHIEPDFRLEQPSEAILHLHRRQGEIDFYFVANNSDTAQENAAAFRAGKKIPELWDAETAETRPYPVFEQTAAGVRLPLRLKPYEAAFFTFRPGPEPVHPTETNADEICWSGEGKLRCRLGRNGALTILTNRKGQNRIQREVRELPAPLDISGEWVVTFQAYKFPKLVKRMSSLRSWTEDSDIRHFSGTARYEIEFDIPALYLGEGRVLWLDLGNVADASKVWLNGHEAGVTWKRPHRHEVTRWAQPGNNFLEVRVSNRLINAVSGMKKPDWADRVVEKYAGYNERHLWYEIVVREYGYQDLPPAGLLGPARLVPMRELEISV